MPALVIPAPAGLTRDERELSSVFNPLEQAESYDARVASHASATVFHTSAWLKVLQETYGFEPLCFTTPSGSLLPVMEIRSCVTGRRGISLPFTDACAPLLRCEADFAPLWAAVQECARRRGWKYVELRGGKELMGDARTSLEFYGHELDLRRDEASLLNGFDSAVRRAIRKAQNSRLRLEQPNDVESMRQYYQLHCQTRRKHGLPPQSWSFFLNIHKHLMSKGLSSLILAKIEKTPVAGGLFFHMGEAVLYKFGASDERRQSLRGNNLVMWEAIRSCAKRGFARLDFGRTSVGQEGLRRFKLSWGASEKRVEYVKWNARGGGFAADSDRATGWHTAAFRMMPIWMLRAAGRVMYRHTA